MIKVDGLVVADRTDEYGVKYRQDGVVIQEFFTACDDLHTAIIRATVLNGQVVKRTIFTTSWETVVED
jgi:hypothetical protein